jgi:hypothetical protein
LETTPMNFNLLRLLYCEWWFTCGSQKIANDVMYFLYIKKKLGNFLSQSFVLRQGLIKWMGLLP